MEMNTRLQVEHPVTEMGDGHRSRAGAATGRGGRAALAFQQDDRRIARARHRVPHHRRRSRPTISARRPESSSNICRRAAQACAWTRISIAATRCRRTTTRCSAKLIVWAPTRQEAIARGSARCCEYEIKGVPTTIPFHLKLLENETFLRGEAYTNFLAEHGEEFGIKG